MVRVRARQIGKDLVALSGEEGLEAVIALENLCSTARKLKLEVVDESGRLLCTNSESIPSRARVEASP